MLAPIKTSIGLSSSTKTSIPLTLNSDNQVGGQGRENTALPHRALQNYMRAYYRDFESEFYSRDDSVVS